MGSLSPYLFHVLCNDNLTFAVARSVRHGLERVEEAGEGGDGGDQLDLETVGLGDQELEQRQTRLRQREVSKDAMELLITGNDTK